MALCAKLLRPVRLCSSLAKQFSTTPEAVRTIDEPVQHFRTSESNPANHSSNHVYRFYTLSDESKDLFRFGGLPKKFEQQVETFGECTFLIRPQIVELISFLKQADYTRPANRYVLYGKHGTGKSIGLAHVLHYAAVTKKIIFHVPWVRNWFAFPKEVANSWTREGLFNTPLDGAAWLVHFKHQNAALIVELGITVSKDYEWSPREMTKSGAPLLELIDLGINRVKYSCDIIYALTDELKVASTAGKCSTLVAIDGFNAIFAESCKIKNDDKKYVAPIKTTISEAFLNITKFDWCNGAVIVTVDPLAALKLEVEEFPRYLLGNAGFEHLDPFLPIHIDNFTIEEFEAMMDYYKDRKWVRNLSEEGQRELELLSARNPYQLMIRTAPL